MQELVGTTRGAVLIIVRSLFLAGNCGPSRIARTRSQLKGRGRSGGPLFVQPAEERMARRNRETGIFCLQSQSGQDCAVGIERFDRVPLLFGPSPVHRLERLSEHLGGAVEIWAKREDCNSGLAYGGNKTRKLEYLAADALAQGCDTLVSIGGVQSNHTRQVAAVAARLGLKCVLVQEHWVEWPDVVYDKVGNLLLSRIMGAEVRLDPAGFDIGIRPSWEEALASVEERGGKPYAIPAGASDHPLGGLGFARWAGEVADQERELGVFFDTIVVCSVTEHPGGHDRRVRRTGRRAARDRHRRVRQARGDQGADRADRAAHGRSARARPRAHRRRRRARRALPRRHLWDPRRADARRR